MSDISHRHGAHRHTHSFPTRRSSDLALRQLEPTDRAAADVAKIMDVSRRASSLTRQLLSFARRQSTTSRVVDVKAFIDEAARSEEHTSELQSQSNLVCRLLRQKKKPT